MRVYETVIVPHFARTRILYTREYRCYSTSPCYYVDFLGYVWSVRFRHATAPITLISYPMKAKRSDTYTVGIPNNTKYANSAVQKLRVNFKNNSSTFLVLAPNSIIYRSRLNEFRFRRSSFCTRVTI